MARRGLQIALTAVGGIAVIFGAQTVLTGGALIPGGAHLSPSVDSELRFYAAWYVAAGLLLLRAVPQLEREGTVIRLVAGFFFVAAAGRLLSILIVGPPRGVFIALMVIEFALPAVLVPWHALVARASPPPPARSSFPEGPSGTAPGAADRRPSTP